jgi:hypothetical protein
MTIISRIVAFILVSVGLVFLLHFFDNQKLAEIQSTPPDAYIMNEIQNLQWGFLPDIVEVFVFGAFYLVVVEIVAYVVRKILQRHFLPT